MYKPRLYNTSDSINVINSFGGYDKRSVINEGSFSHEANMSSEEYPIISPRTKRAYFNLYNRNVSAIHPDSKIAFIRNGFLYYGGEAVEGYTFEDESVERQFVSMGNRLIIFPDKVFIDTTEPTNFGFLESYYETVQGDVIYVRPCKADSSLYGEYTCSEKPPENPDDGDLWLDKSVTPNELKQYSETYGIWIGLSETYIRIDSKGIGKPFRTYDAVEIYGLEKNGISHVNIIVDREEDYITISGILEEEFQQASPIYVSRKVPDLDFYCEFGNRLWGCSSDGNEIFASKLGDPTNFYSYMGISTDSYNLVVGSDGPFTGVTKFRNYLLFFKENCVHKVYGQTIPFSVSTSYIRGVQKGCHRSLVNMNETLYYKGCDGVYSFSGGLPVNVSAPLGKEMYSDACAGVYNDKYYICMSDREGNRQLFVYDTATSIWHREDNADIRAFAAQNNNLYFLEMSNGYGKMGLINGESPYGEFGGIASDFSLEDEFEWECETGPMGINVPNNRYYSRFVIRAAAEKGAALSVDYETDLSGKWQEQFSENISGSTMLTIPVSTPRCNCLRIRIRGKGKVKIYSISQKIEWGSELDV